MPRLGPVQAGAGRKRQAEDHPSSPPSEKRTVKGKAAILSDGHNIIVGGRVQRMTPEWMLNHGYRLAGREENNRVELVSPSQPPLTDTETISATKPKASPSIKDTQPTETADAPEVTTLVEHIKDQNKRIMVLEHNFQKLNEKIVNMEASGGNVKVKCLCDGKGIGELVRTEEAGGTEHDQAEDVEDNSVDGDETLGS